MSAYRAAIARTTAVVARRARIFRNQIVAVVVTAVLMVVWAIGVESFAPLVGLAVLVPICGAFLWVDHRVVEGWRTELLRSWTAGAFEFEAYRAAIRANPSLPRDTVDGMLATLPAFADLIEEQRLSGPSRQGIAAELAARHRALSDEMALKTAASAVVAVVLITAVATGSWEPMWGLSILPALPIARIWVRRRRRSQAPAMAPLSGR